MPVRARGGVVLLLVLSAGCNRSVEFVPANDLAEPGSDMAAIQPSDGPAPMLRVDADHGPDLAARRCANDRGCQDAAPTLRCCAGVCIDAASDPYNCGGCGNVCPTSPGRPGVPVPCLLGSCLVGDCGLPGCCDCDGSPVNGYETDCNQDPSNCGACGVRCSSPIANGLPTCSGGRCVALCAPGFADCNLLYLDGCEVNLSSDDKNCGRCGNVCPPNTRCVGGGCL